MLQYMVSHKHESTTEDQKKSKNCHKTLNKSIGYLGFKIFKKNKKRVPNDPPFLKKSSILFFSSILHGGLSLSLSLSL